MILDNIVIFRDQRKHAAVSMADNVPHTPHTHARSEVQQPFKSWQCSRIGDKARRKMAIIAILIAIFASVANTRY